MKRIRLSELARHLSAELYFPSLQKEIEIEGIASLEQAGPTQITFLTKEKYLPLLLKTKAGAVMMVPEMRSSAPCPALLMKDPYLGFAKVAQLFAPDLNAPLGLHPSVVLGKNVQIAPSASIAAHVVIGDGVRIGEGVIILANTVIGAGVIIGDRTLIHPNVSLYREVKIGQDCVIHSGAVIGSDGFGMAQDQGRWVKIPQLGSVRLGDRVEVGANTTIDRGALSDTVIHDGVKIDNLVHLGHNVEVGEDTAMAAHVGVSGSVKIGRRCILAGKVGLAGHLELADQVVLTGASNVSKSILIPGVYSSGIPAKPQREWARMLAQLGRLDKLQRKFQALEKQVKEPGELT